MSVVYKKKLPDGREIDQVDYFSGKNHQECLKKMNDDEIIGRIKRAKIKKFLTFLPVIFFLLTALFFIFGKSVLAIISMVIFLILAIFSTLLI